MAEASAKLRRRLLQSLLSTYLTEQRSLPPCLWYSSHVRAKPWLAWGWRPPLAPAAERTGATRQRWRLRGGSRGKGYN